MPFFFSILFSCLFAGVSIAKADRVEGRVLEVLSESRSFKLELTQGVGERSSGDAMVFKVGAGDYAIGYKGRRIRGQAVRYADRWHLETIFPIDGDQAEEIEAINRRLHETAVNPSRREILRAGDTIPDFGMVNQNGEFLRIDQLRGRAFILNFIFTRCGVPEMCPASSRKMAELQDRVRSNLWAEPNFVTITLDPNYDSPGVLKEYMRAYNIEPEGFHLLTHPDPLVVEALLYRFGILTREENGTITHTITTFLIDAEGRIVYTENGPRWSVEAFLREAEKQMSVQ